MASTGLKVERLNAYHKLAPELLFENGTKSKMYQYGEVRAIKLAGSTVSSFIAATYVIILKAKGDNRFLLYEGNEEAEDMLPTFDTGLSMLLSIDIEITVDLLTVFLQPKPDEGLVEKMTAEISEVLYLNIIDSSSEISSGYEANGIELEEVDGGLPFFQKQVSERDENKLWDEAFCGPFENNLIPSFEQAESFAATILEVDDTDGASNSILIEAVERDSRPIVLQLLLLGSDPNHFQLSDGNTALHVAVKNNNKVMVKLLLAFKADPTIKNEKGETPIDLAEKGKSHLTRAASAQAKTREYFDSNSSFSGEETQTGTYLMSLDGGGIRGFNTASFLIALEDRMKELSPQCHPIQYYFDYIAGTSFGAIAALSLLYTNHSLRIGRCLVYHIMVKVISSNCPDSEMDKCLQSIFKGEVMPSLRGPPHAIVTTAKHQDKELHLQLITSSLNNCGDGSTDCQVWKAARMSSAAPVIFSPVDGMYYDGGLVVNNPTHAALKKISEIKQKCEFDFVFSVGTGTFQDPQFVDNLQYAIWNLPLKQISRKPSKFIDDMKFLKAFYKKAIPVEESDRAAKSLCNEKGWKYHRWSPPLHKNLGLACKVLDVIIDMMYHTEMYILQNPETIDGIAKYILAKKLAN